MKNQNAFKKMARPVIRGRLGGLEAHYFSVGEIAALIAGTLEPAVQATVNREVSPTGPQVHAASVLADGASSQRNQGLAPMDHG